MSTWDYPGHPVMLHIKTTQAGPMSHVYLGHTGMSQLKVSYTALSHVPDVQ